MIQIKMVRSSRKTFDYILTEIEQGERVCRFQCYEDWGFEYSILTWLKEKEYLDDRKVN